MSTATEICVKEAADQLGVGLSTMYRIIEEGHVRVRRPRPRLIRVDAASVAEFKRQTEDPEYWERRNQR